MTTKQKLVVAAALVSLAFAVIVTRVFVDGRLALSRADKAFSEKKYEEAIFQWRRAARWYAPVASHVTDAYAKLEAFARESEGRGDKELALKAWRGIRSSVKATRSFYVPFPEKLAQANENIARLAAELEDPKIVAGQSMEERRAWHAKMLAQTQAPSVPWTIVALLGLAGWLGGGFLFAFRGLTPEDKLNIRFALASGVMIFVGILVWMTGLYFA